MSRLTSIRAGNEWLLHPVGIFGLVATLTALIALAWNISTSGALTLGMLLYALPVVAVMVRYPVVVVYALMVLCFFANGVTRYIDLPLGLVVDFLLLAGWLTTLARRFPRNWDTPGDPRAWPELKTDGFVISLLWFGFVLAQIANPESASREAWFYAMRGLGFYQVLTVGLVYFHVRKPKQLRQLIHAILAISALGALWGIRQKFFWLDAAEEHWLYVEDHAKQHVLFGELRTFSFYSDAGQFGASQAMAFLMAAVLAIRPPSIRHLVFYAVCFVLCFVGFGISGTRGALAVPAIGGLVYLAVSKNTKILMLGLVVMGASYGVLRYTSLGHGIKQVQRMRTALDPEDASLQVRLRNQEFLGAQLASKPLGAGIGSSGFWGNRFSPHTIFAQTATDSYYVRVWVETGIVGLSLHLLMLGYFLGAGCHRVCHPVDPVIRHQRASLLCAYAGMLMASYGNAVFSQFPTALIMSLAIPVMLGRHWNTATAEQT